MNFSNNQSSCTFDDLKKTMSFHRLFCISDQIVGFEDKTVDLFW